MRMQAARVLPPTSGGGEALDSVIASTFVRISQRAERLCRSRRAVQLELLAHCMLGCAAAFTARGAVIERLFPDSLWRTVQLASKLLARMGTAGPAPKAKAKGKDASKDGLRKRGGKDKDDAAAAAAGEASGDVSEADAEADAEEGLQQAIHGLRVTLVLFLHAAQGPLPNVEKVLAADGAAAAKGAAAGADKGDAAATTATAAAELASTVSRARLVPRVKALLDSPGAIAIVRAAYDAHARPGIKESYAGGMGPLYAFFVAPLLVVACLTGVALLWAPQLLPEQVSSLIPPEVSASLTLRPHQEWVRYAGTALCAGAIILLLAQMISYSGVAPLAPRLAVVHAGLSGHPDVAAVFQARAGSTPLPWEALGPAPHPADVGETPAAAPAPAPAAPASAAGAGASEEKSEGKGKGGGKGAGARPASPASARAGVTAGAGAGAGAAAAEAGEETLTADELAEATGLPVETVDDMVVCLQEVAALQEELAAQDAAREEALDAAFEEAANAVDDKERADAASAAAGSKAAAAPAPPPAGERKYSDAAVAAGNAAVEAARASLPPYTVTLDPKPTVLDSLEQALELLAIKLEEVGEADVADEVAARLRWLQDLRARLVAPSAESADESAAADDDSTPGALAAAAATGSAE